MKIQRRKKKEEGDIENGRRNTHLITQILHFLKVKNMISSRILELIMEQNQIIGDHYG